MVKGLIDIKQPVTICRASAGTGKTYTLAAYYVGLLLSGEDYRSILAITFTNKATAEMSERILGFLHGIAEGGEDAFLTYARSFMIRDNNADEALLRRRAGECFSKMLLDYDNVQIQTIDSFLQTLLSGLASILHTTAAGLSTELDVKQVIRTAVEQLLTTDLTEADRVILEDYMQLKLDQESHWDVRKSLCDLAEELYNESVQILDADGKILFDAQAIAARREQWLAQWQENPDLKPIRELLEEFEQLPILESYGKQPYKELPSFKKSVRASLDNPEKVDKALLFRGLSDDRFEKAKVGKWSDTPVPVLDLAARLTEACRRCRKPYLTLSLTLALSRDMELMASLQALIQRNLAEANAALLARTASTLSKALRTGDADFILEKAGIRYKHVLIDEFQDTSQLQWNVIEQLLRDVLASQGNTLLIVGDIKQSIYRWRNGDWHIMDGLKGNIMPLTKNFRSSEEVVRFNLSLFDHIIAQSGDELTARIYGEGYTPEQLKDFYQADKKPGGCVRYCAYANEKDEELAVHMFDQIEELLAKGTIPSDIMILVRYKSEARTITDLKNALDAEQYPYLTQTTIVSSDSFLLEASTDVQQIIAALRMTLKQDDVAQRYIEMHTKKPDVIEQIREIIQPKMPLYEAVCELVRLLLTDEHGQYTGTETAYINSLLDRTREYVGAYGSDIEQFVTYWDDTMHAKPIPLTSSNAIQILTVHSSKGLQAQTLFVPFAHWELEDGKHKPKVWSLVKVNGEGLMVNGERDYVPIQYGTSMAESAYKNEYEEERTNLRIDNLNMLYVALTRAEDNLFVYTNYSVNKDGKRGACRHIGKYLMDCYGEAYTTGEPVVKRHKDASLQDASLQAELWANSDQVRFVQSQEGALYTDYGEEAYRRAARMEEGTLCHDIFAHIRKADELEAVLDDFETRGLIVSKQQREELKSLISSALNGNAQMRDWFTAPWELRLEEAIYIDRRELRPDRVMINPQTKEAIVLDYKFGQWEDKYIQQVREYMEALRRMGYSPVQGYLWFARKQKLWRVS